MLFPCDIEFNRSVATAESGPQMEAKLSDVYLHVSPTTVQIFLDIIDIIQQDGKVYSQLVSPKMPLYTNHYLECPV